MMDKFSSAKEFTRHVKSLYYKSPHTVSEAELKGRIQFLSTHYKDYVQSKFDADNTRYHKVVENIVDDLYNKLPREYVDFVKKHIYFSTVESELINAGVYRSPDKQFLSVLLNSSLIDLLTKLGKLEHAVRNADCVLFCNRTPDRKPTVTELKDMRKEYYAHFRASKLARGPYLVLDTEASVFHFDLLNIQEKFIIFHEFAHFINGDMFESKELYSDDFFGSYIDSRSHRKEHFADLVAFYLLLLTEMRDGTVQYERRLVILVQIISLFDIFFSLDNKESETHPNPIVRLYCVVEHFYGAKFVDVVEASYRDKKILKSIYLMKDSLDSIEQSFEQILPFLMAQSMDQSNWKQ